MIAITRPPIPAIKVYTTKNKDLSTAQRNRLLILLKDTSVAFGHMVPRLKDKEERFTKAEEETMKAILYYADTSNFDQDKKITEQRAPTFSVYKNKELKGELFRLFKNKCAYCESKFSHTSPPDIEHFRPKAAINRFSNNKDEGLIYPGYYWLGAQWDNLLWSCIYCNRKNKLMVPDEVDPQPRGKKNRFPLSDEGGRVRSHNDDLTQELTQQLLLDPCKDDPSEHLEFLMNKEGLGLIRAKVKDGGVSPHGLASIPAYALDRRELNFERKEQALNVKGIFIGMLIALEKFINETKAGRNTDASEDHFLFLKERFLALMAPENSYIMMKRTLLIELEKIPLVSKLNLDVNDLLEN